MIKLIGISQPSERMRVSPPLVSFLVLSYNYRNYVVETLRSILCQTIQDFEIVVVDDCSSDDSAAVIGSFSDARIKLHVNSSNLGGAASYNKAVELTRGEFIVNVDADDWIAPDKTEKQLQFLRDHPRVSIVGSFIRAVDAAGRPHKEAEHIEAYCNRHLDLNDSSSWIVQNPLCRSSTMLRRADHVAAGLDDPNMVYACDFELWLRFHRLGYRFAVIPEKLTSYRWHGGNITHKNPRAQFLEISFLLARNLFPALDARSDYALMHRALTWVFDHEQFARLKPVERYRIIARFLSGIESLDFQGFAESVLRQGERSDAELIGRRALGLSRHHPSELFKLAYVTDIARQAAALENYRDA
jgi:glycosyltransferase involved in cell wall biosynthesis